MNFIAPLFLIGALAVAAPIIFHLIRRVSRERIPFSSLLFLQPTPPRITKRSRLENIWLLLLRCLVLILLALGFARPFFSQSDALSADKGVMQRTVILVDTSASMKRGKLWTEARDAVQQIVQKANSQDAFAILTFDHHAKIVLGFDDWQKLGASERASTVSARLTQIRPAWSDTHMGSALGTAVDLLEDARNRDGRKATDETRKIIVVSDVQEGSHLDGVQGFEWPRDIALIVEPLKIEHPTNAGLQVLADREDGADNAKDNAIRFRVSNAAGSKREQFKVGWTGESQKGFVGEPVNVYVPPGQNRTLNAPPMPAGMAFGRLILTGDDEDFDNSAYVVPPKPEQVRILYLGDETETDTGNAFYYLKRAFQNTRKEVVQVVAITRETQLLQAQADGASLIIATDVLPDARVKAVQRFLSDGKNVLFAVKNSAAAETVAKLAGVNDGFTTTEAEGQYALLAQIDFTHPMFAPFADPRFSDFSKIHFWKHRQIDSTKLPNAKVIARFDNGDAALTQVSVGKGSLYIWSSTWIPSDSQLALSSKFVPLLYSLLEEGGPTAHLASQFQINDEVALAGLVKSGALTVRKPDGTEVKVAEGKKFTDTDQPGIYTVASTQPNMRFAVNLAPEESRTAPLSLEELEHRGVPIHIQPSTDPKLTEQRKLRLLNTELENRQKLWRWLVAGALIVLVVETWLAGHLTRRAAAQAAATV